MKKGFKISLIVIASLVGALVLGAGGYVGYIVLSYSRIGNQELEVNNRSSNEIVKKGQEYSMTTYNIGFGAYSQDFTFFLDTGYDENGRATCGFYSKARSKDDVLFNVNGAINTITSLDVDFALFQEVDTSSTRSYHVDENKMITDAFINYDWTFGVNFHSAYLPYPIYDMHGKSNAGLATLSKFQMKSAQRYEYTISSSLSKLFDLDRCFVDTTYEVEEGKTLHIVNSHMSAYDKGGKIRAKQLEELNSFLYDCQQKGDYVIVGGDFNHDLLTYNPEFSYTNENKPFGETKRTPDWVSYFFSSDGKSEFIDGYSIVASDNYPTCRNNDIEWEEGKTFTCVVDGFIVSSNIEIKTHKNIQTKQGKKVWMDLHIAIMNLPIFHLFYNDKKELSSIM
ncbi:MAG: endonuclease/exonuclease/phosphatase family protein [Bacilli bacterium]